MSASELGADIAAFPKGGLPMRPGLNSDQLASALAAFAHVIPAAAVGEEAAMAGGR